MDYRGFRQICRSTCWLNFNVPVTVKYDYSLMNYLYTFPVTISKIIHPTICTTFVLWIGKIFKYQKKKKKRKNVKMFYQVKFLLKSILIWFFILSSLGIIQFFLIILNLLPELEYDFSRVSFSIAVPLAFNIKTR